MTSNIYKVTRPSIKGAAYAHYINGVLRTLINEWDGELDQMPEFIPTRETDIFRDKRVNYAPLVPKSVADKVALFCITYKEYKKVTYRATKEEKANLKLVTINHELLKIYFTNNTYPLTVTKSMADYVRHYNTIRDLATNGVPQKTSKEFPDVYDREFENRIKDDVSKHQRYWAHLRSLGWQYIDRVWTSPEQLKNQKPYHFIKP